MKTPSYLLLSGVAIGLTSCGALKNVNQPLSTDGSFDPLDGPGTRDTSGSQSFAPSAVAYTPGQWVETSMANSTFFRAIPKGDATADKVLPAGTPLKFVASQGSYLKVELDSGDVGFVPEIMVTEKGSINAVPYIPGQPVDGVGMPPAIPGVPDDDGFVPIDSVPTFDPTLPAPPTPPAPPVGDIPVPTVPEIPANPDVPEIPAPPTPPKAPTDEAPAPPEIPGITEPDTTD
ncbi:MAG: hypothetical protein ACSHYF_04390 [Verrucomicrobiaceae bacterium]